MKDLVLIKSFPNGIALHLNSEEPFEQVLEEIAAKFAEARNFFGKASMALSIEERRVSAGEEILILDAIQKNSNLNIVCIVEKDEEENNNYINALSDAEKKSSESSDGQFFKGSLKDKEVLETDRSVIILGDVYPGCAVISAKNIIILGGLYGEAYAGVNGQPDAFIAALEMEPERIKIGDFKYKPSGKPLKWGIHGKIQPKLACVKNKKIVFETITKELLSTF